MGQTASARGVRSSSSHNFDEARMMAYSVGAARRTPAVEVALSEAIGRVLAGDIRAKTDLPVNATSAVEGWAVAGDGPWLIVEAATLTVSPELADGTAVPVAAGAPLPTGSRAVLRRKDARFAGDTLEAQRIPPGRDIRPAGEECLAGSVLLAAGTTLSPPMVGLAAAAGWESLSVARRPDVEILFLRGDRTTSAVDGPDALAPQLPAWISSYGGYLVGGIKRCEMSGATLRALQCQADVTLIVASNAASGREELRSVLEDAQAELVIDGVAVRPGHPATLALLPTGRIAIGLPNTPQSALLGVITLLSPVLAGLQGRVIGPLTTGRLDQAIPGRGTDTVLRPVTRTLTPGVYSPVDYVGAGMLRGFAAADGIAVVPSGGRHAGSVVDILALPWTAVC